jgi:hypothetical protein
MRRRRPPPRDASTIVVLLPEAVPVRLLPSLTRGGWRRRRLSHGKALAHGEEGVDEEGDGRYSPSTWDIAESAPFLHRY